jgi:hypothetical protein
MKLGLVFDCTCPDRSALVHARTLRYDPLSVEDGLLPRDFNQDLRRALPLALAAVAPADLSIHLVAFGDTPGQGLPTIENLDSLDGVFQPQSACLDQGVGLLASLATRLDSCWYCSGLDVWDPLGDALQKLLASRDGMVPDAVLIVGNSPPDMPLEGTTPFRALLSFAHDPTGVRRRNRLFTDALKQFRERSVPVVYLFLSHEPFSADEGMAFERFRDMQRLLQDCLRVYLPVVVAPATSEGLSHGVADAWTRLTST